MNNVNENPYNDPPYFRTYLTNVFTALLLLYGAAMTINKPVWGMVFFASSFILWKVNRNNDKLKILAVMLSTGLLLLLISRLFWHNGLQVLNQSVLFVLQALYFTGTVFGLSSLFAVITDIDSNDRNKHLSKYAVHGTYFLTGLINLPYCLFYFYGILVFEGMQPELLVPAAIFFIWMLLYIVQTTVLRYSKQKAYGGLSGVILLTLYVLTRWNVIL